MGQAKSIESFLPWRSRAVFLLICLLLPGCQEKEPPLSQKAAALVIIVQDALAELTQDLATPLAAEDYLEIDSVLMDFWVDRETWAGLPLKRVGVTDRLGAIISDYPAVNQVRGQNFAHFDAVAQALANRGIRQEMVVVAGFPEIFLICAPVAPQGQVLGTVWFALEAGKVKEFWNVGPEEFLRLDFNK